MTDSPLVGAIDLYTRARTAFDRGEFDEARKYARAFEALDYAFVERLMGRSFEWRRNAVCIVAHRALPSTQTLLSELAPLASDPAYCFVLVSNAPEDLFAYAGELLGAAFLGLVTGANFGASAGRNAAARLGEAKTIVFLDDDGLTTPESVKKLVETLDRHDAAAVRGRIVAKSEFDGLPAHYDLGSSTRPWYINIEGMTVWTASALRAEPFDPLLYGHEGADVTARLYPRHGPEAFLYEPEATMRHDFAGSTPAAADKRARMERNEAYLDGANAMSAPIRQLFRTLGYSNNAAASLADRARLIERARSASTATSVSIVTPCDDEPSSLDAYCASVRPFLDEGAEIVLVGAGPAVATAHRAAAALGSGATVRVIETQASTSAATLATAIARLDTEIALVADWGQSSIAERVAWTRAAFETEPDADLVGFLLFDAAVGSRSSLPWPSWREDMAPRSFFGAPCELGALAFRVARIKELLSRRSEAADGFGWLFDALAAGEARGMMMPVAVSFVPDSSRRSAAGLQFERDGRAHAMARHLTLLGPLGPYDEEALDYAVGARPAPTDLAVGRLRSYAGRLVQELAKNNGPQAAALAAAATRLVEEHDLRRLRTDVIRMQTKMQKLEQNAQRLPTVEQELERARDKLEWNREQVIELKQKLASATVDTARFEAQKLDFSSHQKRLEEAERRIRSLERQAQKPSLARRLVRRLRGV